ncbi:MAG: hypothetical protein MUE73_02510 [Planctomycetes bacterium]|jgi:hypothetical protein|nr:hypothetical protein [Planctomycetota bacterium]
MTRAAGLCSGVLPILLFAGCLAPRIDVPAGYVTVPAGDGELLSAVSPDGNRLRVRHHENPPEGTLEFWREAMQNELVAGRGHELLESSAIAGPDDRPGWEFLFRVDRPEGAYLYLVTVRVDGRTVETVEAGGTEAALREDLPELRRAVR